MELDIIRDVTGRLEAAGIEFMLTGSMAMNAYAEPRMTRDVDIVVSLSIADVERIIATLEPDYYVDRGAVERALAAETMFNAIHRESVFKVDFIIRKDTPFRREEMCRRVRMKLGTLDTWLVSKEDLILSKLCWGSPSRSEYQARDIRNLLRTGCDRDYLQRWVADLGVADYLAEIER